MAGKGFIFTGQLKYWSLLEKRMQMCTKYEFLPHEVNVFSALHLVT